MVLNQKQYQILSQKMIMSRQMINAIKLLGLSSEDLQEEIVKEVKRNPALRFKSSAFISASAAESGNKHQEFLENLQDNSYKTLQTHLLDQAKESIRDDHILDAAIRIIQNLDKNGFNWVPIDELFEDLEAEKLITKTEIKKALKEVRRLDPIGCACDGFRQTLLVQARIFCESPKTGEILGVYKKLYELTYDIIKKHYDTLSAVFNTELFIQKLAKKKIFIDENTAEEIIYLIKSLTPYPGQAYSGKQTENKFIVPVAEIRREENEFKIIINDEEIPALEIPPDYNLAVNIDDKEKAKEFLRRAEMFIDVLSYRNQTLLKVLTAILNVQKNFFIGRSSNRDETKKQPGYLKPLKQGDVAEAVGLHPSTVSRVCNEKYIKCEWGFFEIKDLFSSEVSGGLSKDYVKSNIKDIILSGKKISDANIAEILKENGIEIAPRTVNKYRKELCLPSSYYR